MIPEAAVEAAARLLYPGFESSVSAWQDHVRRNARAALEAAAPHMLNKEGEK